jgi:hypothetical protein
MKDILDLLKPYVGKWVTIPLALLLAIPTGMRYLPLGKDQLPTQIREMIEPYLTPRTLGTLVALLLGFFACYVLLYREHSQKPNIKNYTYNSAGYYVDSKTKRHLCPKCLLTPPYIKAPLSASYDRIMCTVCGKTIL